MGCVIDKGTSHKGSQLMKLSQSRFQLCYNGREPLSSIVDTIGL